ncbi:MAG: hypothetical protein JNJ99_06115 [Crocinitomicaceae bacterium]|nr:hypothetical protein [Crocinitomicaceae bacterium]
MDSFFTILRFFIPGCIFGLQIFFVKTLFVAADDNMLWTSLTSYDSGIGFLLMVAVGFLSSVIYRVFFPIHKLNHINSVNYLINEKLILVRNRNGLKIDKIEVGTRGRGYWMAYQILTIVWHDNKSLFDTDKGSYQGTLINSFGSVLIALLCGTFISVVFAILAVRESNFSIAGSIFLILEIGIIFFVWKNYSNAKKMYSNWIESSIISKLKMFKDLKQRGLNEAKKSDIEVMTEIIYFE